jgi:hypothetical protein
MRRILIAVLAICAVLVHPAYGTSFTDRLNAIPDLVQTDPKAHFPYGGVHYCGPCAISNSLVWLGENGYEKLLPRAKGRMGIQVELANRLASRKYMDTTLEWGTSPFDILQGIAKYLKDCGYEYRQLAYQGWRRVPNRFNTGIKTPQPEWIKSGLQGDSAVWLNVGWYKFSPQKDEYVRVGGHWVTLAGFGVDENGKEDPSVVIIHDPGADTPGCRFSNDYVRLQNIDSGTLIGGSGTKQSAAGFYRMTGGMRVYGKIVALLDGAVRLEMKRPMNYMVSGKQEEPVRQSSNRSEQ